MSPREEQLRHLVNNVLGPLLESDGAHLYIVSLREDSVCLHVAGRYAGSPGINLIRRRLVEPLLRRAAPSCTISLTHGVKIPLGSVRVNPQSASAVTRAPAP